MISYAFPTEVKSVGSLCHDYLMIDNREVVENFGLEPFQMKVQALSRTFCDKVFALCDYYMEGKAKRYSRHLYDLYKLRTLVLIDDDLRKLFSEVREHRRKLPICPSAKPDVDIREKIYEFCENDFYRSDYNQITKYFASEMVTYENVISNIREIADELFK